MNDIPGIELLQPNHAGVLVLKDGTSCSYGVIRVKDNKLVYYTGKGLREIWKPTMTDEENKLARELAKISKDNDGEAKLIESGHIGVIGLEEIKRVIS